MKKFLPFLFSMLFSFLAFSQAPEFVNYQAVLRNTDGEISQNEAVAIEFIIHSGSASGTTVYAEDHSATTNEFGLVNLIIGDGTTSSGVFADIDWAADAHFLETVIDGTSAGTQEMVSVPYSLYANKAGSTEQDKNWDIIGNNINNTNSGNVGIGTDDPLDKLYVKSNNFNRITIETEDNFYAGFRSRTATGEVFAGLQGNRYSIFDNTTQTERLTIASDGKIGVGTIVPEAQFHISTLGLSDVDTSFRVGGFGRFVVDSDVVVGGRMTILQNGQVGIGTNTPLGGDKLYVKSATSSRVTLESDDPFYCGFRALTPSANFFMGTQGDQFRIVDNMNNISRLTIIPSGNIGLGTNLPAERLHVIGNICATGSIGVCSDERYKTNFQTIENPLTKVMQLNGLYYDWKVADFPEKEFTTDKQIGVIAQEVEVFFPEIVMTDNEGYKTVDYSKLTPILLEAMKEQQKLIEQLQSDNKELTSEIQTMESNLLSRLDAIEKQLNTVSETEVEVEITEEK